MKKKLIRFFRKIITSISPVLSNKIMYRATTGKKLDIKNPMTFNEKINWLKIYKYPYSDIVIKCADKVAVREYLKNKGLEKYLVNLHYVWDDAKEINWEELPEKFVLKCNHGSGYNIIVKNKNESNRKEIVKRLNKWIKEDFGKVSGELHYSKIPKKIMCEEYLGDNLIDLQVWCSYGEIMFIVYIKNPHGINEKTSFDENWNELDFVTSLPKLNKKIPKPDNLEEIIKIAKDISKDMIFLRMDFYILKNKDIKISELTFSPASGFIKWNPNSYDLKFGNMIHLEDYRD